MVSMDCEEVGVMRMGGLLYTDGLVLNLQWLLQSVASPNLIQSELTGGVQSLLHVRACMQAGLCQVDSRDFNF